MFECVYVCGGAGCTMPAQCECCGSQGDTERGTKESECGRERKRDVRVRGRLRACGNEIEVENLWESRVEGSY